MASALVAVALGALLQRPDGSSSRQGRADASAGPSPSSLMTSDDSAIFLFDAQGQSGPAEARVILGPPAAAAAAACIAPKPPSSTLCIKQGQGSESTGTAKSGKDSGDDSSSPVTEPRTAEGGSRHAAEPPAAAKLGLALRYRGILCALASGASCGLFVPAFNTAVHDTFHTLQPTVPNLSIWAAFLAFTIGEVAAGAVAMSSAADGH